MECLDANVVQDLMAGALEPPARVLAIEHLDGCKDCRDLIALLAKAATHDVAIDTLNDTEKRVPMSVMETVGSFEHGRAATVALGTGGEDDDAMGATLAPHETVTKAVRIRAPNKVGTTLGRYTIVERLGAGAMGVVYRAEDKELGRDVALKLLHQPDLALTGRLIREARSMAQVNHPNVVAVYDVGVEDDTTYIAMELVTGESMRTWQARRTVAELLEAYVDAGLGLAAAHDAGLIHRDFKPDNVLVGYDGRVRVTDFGLAASRPDEDLEESADRPARSIDDINLTTSGSVLGTPAYMAPEQFLGGNVDARTDQFNFCVSLYEALYKQRPFGGKSFDELSDNVCEGKVRPPPPSSRISSALRAIVMRGLSVKPGDRFPTMSSLLAELGRDRAKPWRRTAWVAAALAGVLALGLGADLAVRSRFQRSIRQSFEATAKQADRAVRLVADQFDAISNLVYLFPVMGDVSAHHDQADFGLGDPADDNKDLDEIHERLVSADWRLARDFGGREHPSILAVADYKARMLYTSADPSAPRTDLSTLPWVKQALDAGSGNSTILVRYDDPQLVATKVLGPRPPAGLAMVFARTRSLGEAAKTQFFQIVEARNLLDQIRLDDTLLSIVAPDGTSVGDVPPVVVTRVPREGQAEIMVDGVAYEAQVRPLTGFGPQPIGSLVMAQRMDGVLSLFPSVRLVFAIGLVGMLGLALGTALRARQIAGARVH